MKHFFLLALICISTSLFAQDITGSWYGMLEVPGQSLRIQLDIEKTPLGYTSLMYSLDQSEKGIAAKKTFYSNSVLTVKIAMGFIQYTGMFTDSMFVGEFKQMGQTFPLNLGRTFVEKKVVLRPQDPTLPYSYVSEEVSFPNELHGITLSGTFTRPYESGKYPVVVLISGSGPQNRDEEIANHRPFLVLSDYFTRNGIAVLRYDDRGFAKSTGCHDCATTADFATDVLSAIRYLKLREDIDTNYIGLLGHSEGGMIAPLVVSQTQDVHFMVLLAAPGMTLGDIIIEQSQLISRADSVSEEQIAKMAIVTQRTVDIVKHAHSIEHAKKELEKYIRTETKKQKDIIPQGIKRKDFIQEYVHQFTSPWMVYALNYEPTKFLQQVHCHVLAVNGEKDLQVTAQKNLEIIEKSIRSAGNINITTKSYPRCNHLFQECTTGSPSEYGVIEQTVSPEVMQDIVDWIQSLIKK